MIAEEIDDLERRALRAGTTMMQVCREAGVSRSLYTRWKHTPPRALEIWQALQEAIDRIEAERIETLRELQAEREGRVAE